MPLFFLTGVWIALSGINQSHAQSFDWCQMALSSVSPALQTTHPKNLELTPKLLKDHRIGLPEEPGLRQFTYQQLAKFDPEFAAKIPEIYRDNNLMFLRSQWGYSVWEIEELAAWRNWWTTGTMRSTVTKREAGSVEAWMRPKVGGVHTALRTLKQILSSQESIPGFPDEVHADYRKALLAAGEVARAMKDEASTRKLAEKAKLGGAAHASKLNLHYIFKQLYEIKRLGNANPVAHGQPKFSTNLNLPFEFDTWGEVAISPLSALHLLQVGYRYAHLSRLITIDPYGQLKKRLREDSLYWIAAFPEFFEYALLVERWVPRDTGRLNSEEYLKLPLEFFTQLAENVSFRYDFTPGEARPFWAAHAEAPYLDDEMERLGLAKLVIDLHLVREVTVDDKLGGLKAKLHLTPLNKENLALATFAPLLHRKVESLLNRVLNRTYKNVTPIRVRLRPLKESKARYYAVDEFNYPSYEVELLHSPRPFMDAIHFFHTLHELDRYANGVYMEEE